MKKSLLIMLFLTTLVPVVPVRNILLPGGFLEFLIFRDFAAMGVDHLLFAVLMITIQVSMIVAIWLKSENFRQSILMIGPLIVILAFQFLWNSQENLKENHLLSISYLSITPLGIVWALGLWRIFNKNQLKFNLGAFLLISGFVIILLIIGVVLFQEVSLDQNAAIVLGGIIGGFIMSAALIYLYKKRIAKRLSIRWVHYLYVFVVLLIAIFLPVVVASNVFKENHTDQKKIFISDL